MTGPSTGPGGLPWLDRWIADHGSELVTFRRDVHAHPELGYREHRTTGKLVDALSAVGLAPRVLPVGTGLACDIGSGDRMVALRADIDALPLQDVKDVP